MVPWTLAEKKFCRKKSFRLIGEVGQHLLQCSGRAAALWSWDDGFRSGQVRVFSFLCSHRGTYLSLVCPSTGPSRRSNANELPSKDDQLLQLQLGDKPTLLCTETAKLNICLSFQCSAVAAVAQTVWHPELRSLWEEHTKQTLVWFPVASDEVGENPARAIYDTNIEVRMRLQTHFNRMFSATNLVTRLWLKLVLERLSVEKFHLYSNFIYKRHWWFPMYRAFFVLLYHKAIDVDKNWCAK